MVVSQDNGGLHPSVERTIVTCVIVVAMTALLTVTLLSAASSLVYVLPVVSGMFTLIGVSWFGSLQSTTLSQPQQPPIIVSSQTPQHVTQPHPINTPITAESQSGGNQE